jgi:mono/diheme cytochrome c family protein
VRAIATYLTERGPASGTASGAARRTAVDAANAREFDAVARRASDRASDASRSAAATDDAGEVVFAGACAICHYAGDALPARKPAPLALATSVNAPDPRNALQIVLNGLHPESGEAGAIMPGFAHALTDAQIAAVVQYTRARFSSGPAWTGIDEALRAIERGESR